MPRKVALLAALASLALAAPASADVTPTLDANQVAGALAEPLGGAFAGAVWEYRPSAGNPSAVGTTPLAGLPTAGTTFAVLSSGDAALADDPNAAGNTSADNGGGEHPHGATVQDLVTLNVALRIPDGVSCLRVDLRFLSEEFPEFVQGNYNDAFVAELDASTFTSAEDGTLTAPNNFAFDGTGRPLTINTTTTFTAEEATGTTYDGATPLLRASTPITPGPHTLYLSIFDQGNDADYDSTVFLDALRMDSAPCAEGTAVVDGLAPGVAIAAPANGSTITGAPTYSGSAGDAPGDSPQVTVRTTSSAGQTVEAVATRAGTGWSVAGAALAPGTYTAVAIQGDASGNVGQSAPVTFTVAAQETGPPPPVTGKAVNVAVVKGKVRIRRPGGKFVLLDDASQIPTGSTVDTRSGTVELTSTAKGGKTQKARFFEGMFKVTQSRGKTPVTTLALNEPLARCTPKKQAKSSAKRKRKRRLWGDGKGNFRTSGRRSAATVTGTKWLVEDSCKGTMTRVVRGTVKVRDYKKKKTVKVKAGKRYMAR